MGYSHGLLEAHLGQVGHQFLLNPVKKTQKIKRVPSCQQNISKLFSYFLIQPGDASPSISPDMEDVDVSPGLTFLPQQAQRKLMRHIRKTFLPMWKI